MALHVFGESGYPPSGEDYPWINYSNSLALRLATRPAQGGQGLRTQRDERDETKVTGNHHDATRSLDEVLALWGDRLIKMMGKH